MGAVSICEPDPISHTVAVLGALAAGRPALLIDARQPDAVLIDAVNQAGATTCVGRAVAGITNLSFEELIASPPADLRSPVASSTDRGTIFLTSGSTGRPKLVVRSRGADVHASLCLPLARFPIGPGDRHWLAVPHASAAFLTLVMGSLIERATVVFAPFVRDGVDRMLAELRISSVYLVPTMLRLAREHDGLSGPGWDALRALAIGGERLDDETAAILHDRFLSRGFCAYGMTECPRVAEATLQEISERPGTVGRPIALRQVKIAPLDSGGGPAIGGEGAVLVRGPDLFSGYQGGPPVGEWHRTGDRGWIDKDGYLYITGRDTAVVNVAGNRVSTEEIGAVLCSHPDVAQAAVIAVQDALRTNRLEAFAVLKPGRRLSGEDVTSWLEQRVARYQIPRRITFMEDLPTDSSGKISLSTLHGLVLLRLYVYCTFVPADQIVPLAVLAEELGFDGISVPDHVIYPMAYESRYPYTADERAPWTQEMEWPDSLVVIATMAARTTVLRFITGVFVLPLRHPLVVAKALSTLEVLSGGRVELGIGVGWLREEFETLGQSFVTRGGAPMRRSRSCARSGAARPSSITVSSSTSKQSSCGPRRPDRFRFTLEAPACRRWSGQPDWATASSRP